MFVMFFKLLSRARDYPFCGSLVPSPPTTGSSDSIQAMLPCVVVSFSLSRLKKVEKWQWWAPDVAENNILWWKLVWGEGRRLVRFTQISTNLSSHFNPWMDNAAFSLVYWKNQQKKITRTISFTPPPALTSHRRKRIWEAGSRSWKSPFFSSENRGWQKWFIQIFFRHTLPSNWHKTPTMTSCLHDLSSFNGLLSAPGFSTSCRLKWRKEWVRKRGSLKGELGEKYLFPSTSEKGFFLCGAVVQHL